MTEPKQNRDQEQLDTTEQADLDDAILSIDNEAPTTAVPPVSSEPAEPQDVQASEVPAEASPEPTAAEEDDIIEQEEIVEPEEAEPPQKQESNSVDEPEDSTTIVGGDAQDVQTESSGEVEATPSQPTVTGETPPSAPAAETESYRIQHRTDAARDRVVGIDLGTTYSAISSYSPSHERVEVLSLNQIAEGQLVVPSVVYYPSEGKPVVGTSAVNMKNVESDRVIEAIKRSMGLDWTRTIDDRELTPAIVSADILEAVFGEAKHVVGREENRVVITVPAHFEDAQLDATRKAGEKAGLEVLSLLPEPHAAALAFTVERVSGTVESQTVDLMNRHVLIFDLGGGTLDVALIYIASSEGEGGEQAVQFKTIFKEGNRHLGGLDWDKELEVVVLDKYRQEVGDEEYKQQTSHSNFLPTIREKIEQAKRALSQLDRTRVPVLFSTVDVTRDEFEKATVGLLLRCQAKLKAVLDRAEKELGVSHESIPVVMAGGSTKMPQIAKMIHDFTGNEPLESSNRELLVATGAAYWAHLLVAGGTLPTGDGGGLMVSSDQGIRGIVNYSVGIKTFEQDEKGEYTVPVYSQIIPRGSCRGSASDTFEERLDTYLQTALKHYEKTRECPENDEDAGIFADLYHKSRDGMTRIPIVMYSGHEDSPDLEKAKKMGEVYIMGLPPNGKKGQPVLVALGHDADGILRGRSVDIDSGNCENIVIERSAEGS